MAMTGLPPLSTSVGVSVTRGRLPGAMTFGWPSQVLKLVRRAPWMIPVCPATPAVLDSPLGVAVTTLPQWSVTHMVVVPPFAVVVAARRGQRPHVVRISRPQLERRPLHVDQRPANARVLVGEKRLKRHLDKRGIAIILVAVGEGQLHRLGDDMNVVRRLETHLLELEPFEQSQHLEHRRTLRPRTAFEHRIAPITHMHRIFHPRPMGRQIRPTRETRLSALYQLSSAVGDVAAIEAIGDGLQALLAAAGRASLGVHQLSKGGRQVGLPVHTGFDLLPASRIDEPCGAAGIEDPQRGLHSLGKALRAIHSEQRHDGVDAAGTAAALTSPSGMPCSRYHSIAAGSRGAPPWPDNTRTLLFEAA